MNATISNHQIQALQDAAGEAGDLEQVAICEIAFASGASGQAWPAAGRMWTHEEARAECARIIADAKAQES